MPYNKTLKIKDKEKNLKSSKIKEVYTLHENLSVDFEAEILQAK